MRRNVERKREVNMRKLSRFAAQEAEPPFWLCITIRGKTEINEGATNVLNGTFSIVKPTRFAKG